MQDTNVSQSQGFLGIDGKEGALSENEIFPLVLRICLGAPNDQFVEKCIIMQ